MDRTPNRQEAQCQLEQYIDEHLSEPATRAHRTRINKLLRQLDDSHLWPILNRFNATDRAIRQYDRECRKYQQEIADSVYSYYHTIYNKISEIVNDPRNW